MKNKSFLELADVKAIAGAAEAAALKHNWAVSIAIVDDGGHLLWLQRLDGAPRISSHIAPGKANTAALGRRESKVYEDMINGTPVHVRFDWYVDGPDQASWTQSVSVDGRASWIENFTMRLLPFALWPSAGSASIPTLLRQSPPTAARAPASRSTSRSVSCRGSPERRRACRTTTARWSG